MTATTSARPVSPGTWDPYFALLRRHAFIIVLAIACYAVFSSYYQQIENMFYGGGAYLMDAGWFAHVLSNPSMPAENPRVFVEEGQPTYFAMHVTPTLPVWGAMAQLLHWSPAHSFAMFQGAVHAALVIAGVAAAAYFRPGRFRLWLGLAVGVTLAFSPIAMSAIGYPHTEPAIPVLIILFILALAARRWLLAAILFVACAGLREDAGLHLALFLMAYAALDWIQHRKWDANVRIAAIAAAAGVAAGVIGFAAKSLLFPGYDNFSMIYSGNGFDHLSIGFYVERVYRLLVLRPELLALFAIPVAAAAISRRLSDLAPIAATGPWLLLSISATSSRPGELFSYYAFPFLVMQAWPFLRVALDELNERRPPQFVARRSVAAFGGLSALAFFLYFAMPFGDFESGSKIARHAFFEAFQPRVHEEQVESLTIFTGALERDFEGPAAAGLLVDDAVISLTTDTARHQNRYASQAFPDWLSNHPDHAVVFFRTYLDTQAIRERFLSNPEAECYILPGTNVAAMASSEADEVLSHALAFLRPVSCAAL